MHLPTCEVEPDRLLNFAEVARILGVSVDSVRRLADRDPAFPQVVYVLKNRPRFRASEVQAYLERLLDADRIDCHV